MSVYKGDQAVELYGNDAKDGVIEVITKSAEI